ILSPRPFVPSLETSVKEKNLNLVRATRIPLIGRWWKSGLPRYLRKNHFDLFHGTNFELPLTSDCATVLTIHDLSTLLLPHTHEGRNVARAKERLPGFAKAATMIVSPTDAIRQEIHEHLRIPLDKIVAIHEAARDCFQPLHFDETASIRKRFGVEGQFILYVGTVEPRKNLLRLVQAFEQCRREYEEPLQLVIAGRTGWMVNELYDYVRYSDAREAIVFSGYLSDRELQELYSSCVLFLYPSHYEGFGLPPLEAMACGAPVIASNIDSIMEVTGSAARLVKPEVPDLKTAMLDLLMNWEARETLSRRGKQRAAQFSWSQTARRMREVYVEAIERFRAGK
ncbi:MAG TPA: glycosyltransferase family 1 protein, partial [Pyrinomonadaceae bacterium]|nr:glycosyltransferase family 1 protein [Pyrinomonadaceae bacterium]